MAKNFVRGGQLHLHNLRMIKQVMTVGFLISFFVGAGVFSMRVLDSIPFYIIKQYVLTYKAEYILPWKSPYQRHHYSVSWPQEEGSETVRAIDILQSAYTYELRDYVKEQLNEELSVGLKGFFWSFALLLLFWF